MAREGITRAQVFNAADAISTAGQQPTVANVRAKLGTGSYTTITALLREWKEQSIGQERDDALDVPEEVTAALGRAAEIVWRAANDHFTRELAAMRKETERHAQQSAADLEEAVTEIERLEQDLSGMNVEIAKVLNIKEKLQAENENYRKAHAEHTAEQKALRAELKAAEARIAEQADLLRRLVPEGKPKAKTDPAPKRVKRPAAEPIQDDKTRPLEI